MSTLPQNAVFVLLVAITFGLLVYNPLVALSQTERGCKPSRNITHSARLGPNDGRRWGGIDP